MCPLPPSQPTPLIAKVLVVEAHNWPRDCASVTDTVVGKGGKPESFLGVDLDRFQLRSGPLNP